MKQYLKKLLALLLALTLVGSLFVGVALAEGGDGNDDGNGDGGNTTPAVPSGALINLDYTEGSITVKKYANYGAGSNSGTNTNPTTGGANSATGSGSDQVTDENKPLNEVYFRLRMVGDSTDVKNYYNGTTTESISKTANTITIEGKTTVWYGKTTDGEYTFEHLPVGFYVLEEMNPSDPDYPDDGQFPDQITNPLMDAVVISIPMVNSASISSANNGNAAWMYHVTVYPKNHVARGEVEIQKKDADGPLEGVTYQLRRLSNGQAENDVFSTMLDDGSTFTYDDVTTDANGIASFKNLPAGLDGTWYQIVEVSAPAGYIVNSTPVKFKVNANNTITWDDGNASNKAVTNHNVEYQIDGVKVNKLTINMENLKPDITKTVHDLNSNTNTWDQDASFDMNEDIEYKVNVKIPSNITELRTFKVQDTLSAGLTMDVNSLKVVKTDAEETALVENTDYGVVKTTGGYTITFCGDRYDGTALNGLNEVNIVYTAHLNQSVVFYEDGNENDVTLTYSNSIGTEVDTTDQIEDEVRVYTFEHAIEKKLENPDTTQIPAGVEFELYRDVNATDKVKLVDLGDGEYRVASKLDQTTTTTMVTPNDGKLLIKGLDEKTTYYLKETKTVAGYNLLADLFEITVNAGYVTNWNTENVQFVDNSEGTSATKVNRVYTNTSYENNEEAETSTIINRKGMILPQTGSMGYLLFCSVGVVLVLGGAMLMMSGRKRKIR